MKLAKDMTRLDYLAGCALQGLLANTERHKLIRKLVDNEDVSQDDVIRKNTNKAMLIAEDLEQLLTNAEAK